MAYLSELGMESPPPSASLSLSVIGSGFGNPFPVTEGFCSVSGKERYFVPSYFPVLRSQSLPFCSALPFLLVPIAEMN